MERVRFWCSILTRFRRCYFRAGRSPKALSRNNCCIESRHTTWHSRNRFSIDSVIPVWGLSSTVPEVDRLSVRIVSDIMVRRNVAKFAVDVMAAPLRNSTEIETAMEGWGRQLEHGLIVLPDPSTIVLPGRGLIGRVSRPGLAIGATN